MSHFTAWLKCHIVRVAACFAILSLAFTTMASTSRAFAEPSPSPSPSASTGIHYTFIDQSGCRVEGGVGQQRVLITITGGDDGTRFKTEWWRYGPGDPYVEYHRPLLNEVDDVFDLVYPDDGEHDEYGIRIRISIVGQYGDPDADVVREVILDKTYWPSDCAVTNGGAPSIVVSGTSKVVTSPVERSIRVCNVSKRDGQTYSLYLQASSQDDDKVLFPKLVGPLDIGKCAKMKVKVGAGTYTVYGIQGQNGGVTVIGFTVKKYAAPTYTVTNKKRGYVKVCGSYPSYKLMWEDSSSKGTSFGKNHWKDTRRPGCTTLNTPNVKEGKTNWVRVTVSVAGPNVVKKIKISR